MKVEVNVAAVGDEDTVVDVGEALLLELAELTEEAGDVEDDRGTDEVHAVGVDETRGEKVEVVLDAISDCGTAAMSVVCVHILCPRTAEAYPGRRAIKVHVPIE